MDKQISGLKPLIKWAGGGKRALVPLLVNLMPDIFNALHEPFAGGAALSLSLTHTRSHINDINTELICFYLAVRDQLDDLLCEVKQYGLNKDDYYRIRHMDRVQDITELSIVQRAARFIYLNKTCYSGLYRVNRRGQFNTPYGRYKNPSILDERMARRVSEYLSSGQVTITNMTYLDALSSVSPGDLVYLDPPYDKVAPTSFTRYDGSDFGRGSQEELKQLVDELNEKGVMFIMSNSNTEYVQKAYSKYRTLEVMANRFINSDASKRGKVTELIIMNY